MADGRPGAAAVRRPGRPGGGRPDAWPGDRLVQAAQEGDEASLSALLSGCHPHIHRFASSLCSTPQDAEDAAQEALIILYRKIGTLRASGALAAWMYRIVRNECIRRARLVLGNGPAPVPDVRQEVSAEDAALHRLEAERVAAAVAALPADQRMVLVMRDVQGLPGRAVAQRLGLSQAAMKSRLHRARAAVRESLRPGGQAGPEVVP